MWRAPKSLTLPGEPTVEEFTSSKKYHFKWQLRYQSLMENSDKNLRMEQARYKRNLNSRLRKPNYDIPVGSYIFLRKKRGTKEEPSTIYHESH